MSAAGPEHPFIVAFREAAERQNLTREAACRGAGIDVGLPSRWASGVRLAYRETLDRLVGVLDAPELLDLVAWRWRRYHLTCTRCGAERDVEPGYLRDAQGRGFLEEAEVDERTGKGTELCQRCKHSDAGKRTPFVQRLKVVAKKKGKEVARQVAKDHMAGLRNQRKQPEEEIRAEALAKAHEVRLGLAFTDEQRLHSAAGNMDPRPAWAWFYCPRCNLIGAWRPKPSALRRTGEMHGDCRSEHLHENQKAFGKPVPAPSRTVRSLTGPGTQYSPAELADNYEMAVCHLIRREDLELLAERFRLDSSTVEKRISAFVDRLPADDRGGQDLLKRATVLRWARTPQGREWLLARWRAFEVEALELAGLAPP